MLGALILLGGGIAMALGLPLRASPGSPSSATWSSRRSPGDLGHRPQHVESAAGLPAQPDPLAVLAPRRRPPWSRPLPASMPSWIACSATSTAAASPGRTRVPARADSNTRLATCSAWRPAGTRTGGAPVAARPVRTAYLGSSGAHGEPHRRGRGGLLLLRHPRGAICARTAPSDSSSSPNRWWSSVAYLARRPARTVTAQSAWATWLPRLRRDLSSRPVASPDGAHPQWGLQWGLVLQFCGVVVCLWSFFALLGRSFGFAAADRGLVQRRPPTAIVRHPHLRLVRGCLQTGYSAPELLVAQPRRGAARPSHATPAGYGPKSRRASGATNPEHAAYTRRRARWRVFPGLW